MRRTLLVALLGSIAFSSFAQTVDPKLYSGLVWRNVGPFRGGRVACVTGTIGQAGTYYMGMPIGGVWKSTNAGVTWECIKDDFEGAASIGSIEVAPSDPNIVYVGTGEIVDGADNCGTGAYKSTDAGKTWQSIGLAGTKQIVSIVVNPTNPNIVVMAALGPNKVKSPERGVFRSTDGGKTWTKTLYIDDATGAAKIACAFDEPNVMICSMKKHLSAGGFGGLGGEDRLYKSTDGGVTWKELTGGGLPTLSGRQGLAIAMHSQGKRMYMVQNTGLWRSDDGGENWRQMDQKDQRVRNGQGGYNCGVYVNSANPDIVYVVNTCSYISKDGGETFTGFKGAPGGDDPQQFWFDPMDANRIFLGGDQGATISQDGGRTWGSWYNQPTAQVYHIAVDNQWPYWIYATQQDSGSVGTASRGNLGFISPFDWTTHPGYEFGSICADPLNPAITYAGSESSGIIKTIKTTQQFVEVSPSMDGTLGLRHVSNQPIGFSPVNPHELIAAFQYLMSTTDGGLHWKKLSPDLAAGKTPPTPAPAAKKEDPKKPDVKKGNVEAEPEVANDDDDDDLPMSYRDKDYNYEQIQRRGGGGAIDAYSVSVAQKGVIWAGTSNGFIQVTKDHGGSWDDVSMTSPVGGDVNSIDASHSQPGTAYATVDRRDGKPYVYRTKDFGKSWRLITRGLPTDEPNGSFARVVREDTVRPGLLYLGTESKVYVSFDEGDHWQSLMNNLPITSYRDMVVKDNDLVVGTYGRAFWILDDLSPLREISASVANEDVHFFKPAEAIRVRRNVNWDTPFPPEVPHALNPPTGATFYYWLKDKPTATMTLEVLNSKGEVVRHLSSDPIAPLNEPAPPIPDFWVAPGKPLPTTPGLNKFTWNLRWDSPPANFHSYEINATPGETEPSPAGPIVAPGKYTMRLTVAGKTYTQPLTVKNDPRSPASVRDVAEMVALQELFYHGSFQATAASKEVAAVRKQVEAVLDAKPSEAVSKAVEDMLTKLNEVGGRPVGGRGFGRPQAGAATLTSLGDQGPRMVMQMDGGDGAPTEAQRNVGKAYQKQLLDALARWDKVKKTDLTAFNAALAKEKISPLKF